MSKSNSNNNSASGGIGFWGLLAIAFIVLKLTKVIQWSWLWVLAPLWIPTLTVVLIILAIGVVYMIKAIIRKKIRKNRGN